MRLGRDSLWFGWIRPARLRKLSEPRIPRMRAMGVSSQRSQWQKNRIIGVSRRLSMAIISLSNSLGMPLDY